MLAKSRKLKHPSGFFLESPALVPSFSSNYMGFEQNGRFPVAEVLKVTSEFITDYMLVSAYDISYKYLPSPDKFPCKPDIIFVDSGLFESSDYIKLSNSNLADYRLKKWNINYLMKVYDKWPKSIPAVFVNFDEHLLLNKQIEKAIKFFKKYPDQLHCLLIKTEKAKDQYFSEESINFIKNNAAKFSDFHIIGLTEKELGESPLDRMKNIARIRMALDKAGVDAMLQIFGGLDPLSSSLYFISGAEIFDGLTWLRYSYSEGKAMYANNWGAVEIGIHVKDDLVRAQTWTRNYYDLKRLQLQMKVFVHENNFNSFRFNKKILQDAYSILEANLDELKGG